MALKFQVTAVDNGVSSPLYEVNEEEFNAIKNNAPDGLVGIPNIFAVHQFSKNSYLIQIWPSDDQKI
jgi:hypothetical protein